MEKSLCTHEILCLLKELYKYDLQRMEPDEIHSLVYLIHRQLHRNTAKKMEQFRCVITSSKLMWHDLSLRNLIHNRFVVKDYVFLIAKLYVNHRNIYLDIYYKREK